MFTRRAFCLVIVFSLFLQSLFVIEVIGDLTDPGALSPHARIRIDGNSQFTAANGVVSGSGSSANPYIIEDWEIDATNGHGIYISNTNAHFIIRNCHVFNGTNQSHSNHGIYLDTVVNGEITNNRLNSNSRSIYLASSDDNTIKNNLIHLSGRAISFGAADNNTVDNNTVHSSSRGIYILNSQKNTVSNNNVFNITQEGIYLDFTTTSDKVFGNTIHDCNKGIDLYRPTGDRVYENTIYNITGSAITMFDTKTTKLYENTIYNASNGIYFATATQSTLFNNTFHNCTISVTFYGASGSNTFHNNKFNDNLYNLRFYDGFAVNHFSQTITTNNTVNGDPIYFWRNQNDRVVPSDAGLVALVSCNNITVQNLSLSNSYHGILLAGTQNSHITNNTVTVGYSGIFLYSTNKNTILKNEIHDCTIGIHSPSGARNGDIGKNQIHNNTYGILLSEASTTGNTVHNNTIVDNAEGIRLSSATSNTIYNNHFKNTLNYNLISAAGNVWNITKTLGENILEGMYIGGNYWDDYAGTDTDGDWIGDTNLPYGPGDSLPLCVPTDLDPPAIEDNTTGDPTTGDSFTLKANVSDSSQIVGVWTEYWFDDDSKSNETMDQVGGSLKNGSFELNITAPSGAHSLNYSTSALDAAGNYAITIHYHLDVLDNDAPSLTDMTTGSPSTGGTFQIKADASDNIGVANVTLEHWFNSLQHYQSMMEGDGTYGKTLEVPTDASSLHYFLSVNDTSNNTQTLLAVHLLVIDDILPSIEDLSAAPTSGEDFLLEVNVTDNIAVADVSAEYWFDDRPHESTIMVDDGTYKRVISVPISSEILNYVIKAVDTSGNTASISNNLLIDDTAPPTITDETCNPTTGDEFQFNYVVSDNIGITSVTVEYWFDGGSHTNISGLVVPIMEVPSGARMMYYIIAVRDTSGNSVVLEDQRPVLDNDPPMITLAGQAPTTGDVYEFEFDIMDNIGLCITYLEYWYPGAVATNVTYSEGLDTLILSEAVTINYMIIAFDTSGNACRLTGEMAVIDNDAPNINGAYLIPKGDGSLMVKSDIEDNMGVERVEIEYRFDDGATSVVTLSLADGMYTAVLGAPPKDSIIHYSVKALDAAGNSAFWNSTAIVKDILDPGITDRTGTPTTGDELPLIIELAPERADCTIGVEYWFDQEEHRAIDYEPGTMVSVPKDAKHMYYMITTTDPEGVQRSLFVDRVVVDNDSPEVIDFSDNKAIVGENLTFKVEVHDNIGIGSVKVSYRHGDKKKTIDLALEADVYIGRLLVEDLGKELHYTIIAEDLSGNIHECGESSITVEGVTPRPREDTPAEFPWLQTTLILTVILILIIGALGGYRYLRSRK